MGAINKFLDGNKTKIAMVSAVATFIVLVCNQISDGVQISDYQAIIAGFTAMMAVLGLGHKAQKIEALLGK